MTAVRIPRPRQHHEHLDAAPAGPPSWPLPAGLPATFPPRDVTPAVPAQRGVSPAHQAVLALVVALSVVASVLIGVDILAGSYREEPLPGRRVAPAPVVVLTPERVPPPAPPPVGLPVPDTAVAPQPVPTVRRGGGRPAGPVVAAPVAGVSARQPAGTGACRTVDTLWGSPIRLPIIDRLIRWLGLPPPSTPVNDATGAPARRHPPEASHGRETAQCVKP